jgi:predicted transcriptional regulator
MSVYPWVAAAILDGRKTAEMRRIVPRLVPGDRVLLYATKPVQRIVASHEVGGTRGGAPEAVAERWHAESNLTLAEALDYLTAPKPATRPGVILIERPVALEPTPIRFAPPQSYQLFGDDHPLAKIEPSEEGRKILEEHAQTHLAPTVAPNRSTTMAPRPQATIVNVNDAATDPSIPPKTLVPSELAPDDHEGRMQIVRHMLYLHHRLAQEQLAVIEATAVVAGLNEKELEAIHVKATADHERDADEDAHGASD